jgi:hypothetical protein
LIRPVPIPVPIFSGGEFDAEAWLPTVTIELPKMVFVQTIIRHESRGAQRRKAARYRERAAQLAEAAKRTRAAEDGRRPVALAAGERPTLARLRLCCGSTKKDRLAAVSPKIQFGVLI